MECTAEKRLIGEEALAQAIENPVNAMYEVKRLISERTKDSTVAGDVEIRPFNVFPDRKGKPQLHAMYSAFANSCPLQTDTFRSPLVHSHNVLLSSNKF